MAYSSDTNQTILDLTNATDISGLTSTSLKWTLNQIIWPCMIVFGICTNVSFMWTVLNTPSLHTSTYRYLVNLSISDLLFLMIFYIPRIIEYHGSPLKGNQIVILRAFTYLFLCCSCGTITLVSLERFLAICHPIKHHLIKGTKRTNKFICLVWCISLCLAVLLFISSVQINHWIANLVDSMNFLIFVFLMVFNNVLNTKTYFAVKTRNNDSKFNLSSDSQHRQVAKMLIVNGVFFFLCVSLQIFAFPLKLIFTYLIHDNPVLFLLMWGLLSDIMLGLDACMNPILYLITNKRYRHAFVIVFTWSSGHRQTKNEVNNIKLHNINQM